MDRGANGGHRNDARVHHVHLREVDVTGIDNHEPTCSLVDAAAKIMTNKGPAGIFRQYAYHGVNRTIHSSDNLKPQESC
jgi:hypothetical protein